MSDNQLKKLAIKSLKSYKAGELPTLREFTKLHKLPEKRLIELFGSYRELQTASGFQVSDRLTDEKIWFEYKNLIQKCKGIPPLKEWNQKLCTTEGLRKRVGNWRDMPGNFIRFCKEKNMYKTELKLLTANLRPGEIYLVRVSPGVFKIGQAISSRKRRNNLNAGMPDGRLLHIIATDDMDGIEDYWHRRFANKNLGKRDQFALTQHDVNTMRLRTFM